MREAMKGRTRELEPFNGDSSFSDNWQCRKHKASSSSSNGGGICPFCLRDRLVELFCSECGEQRLSSCSCSKIYSDPNTNPETGTVGRISFLLESENTEHLFLKRSNSSCVNGGTLKARPFWRIARMFRKKSEKSGNCEKNDDLKNEIWVSDLVGIPRSRSLCSFRGGVNGGRLSYDTARASSVSGSLTVESAKRSCFSESEARISNFEARISNFEYEKEMNSRGIFTMREGCEMSNDEDPKFIDLKPGLMASKEFGFDPLGSNLSVKKCRKSAKVWRWVFR